MARRGPVARGDRPAAQPRACRPAGGAGGRSVGPPHRLVRAVRRRGASAGRSRRGRACPAARQGAAPACRHGASGRPDGSAGEVRRRTQLRAPAASRAERPRRGSAARGRRPPGHDLLGLRRRRDPARRVPGHGAGTVAAGPAAQSRLVPRGGDGLGTGPRDVDDGPAHGVVAVASAGRSPSSAAGVPGVAGPSLPAARRESPRCGGPRRRAQPVGAPAGRPAADALRHAAARQRAAAPRTRAPDRRSGAARRRLRGGNRRPGRRDCGSGRRQADRQADRARRRSRREHGRQAR